ncbi:MAG TPA: DUF4238 domain-containing protein [Chloroflexota bacterium]|nr:DUF4238 domain-containing protein [Chloroflexota bacterium]
MTQTKAQHTVPQFYLRRFASNQARNPSKLTIWCLDKVTGQERQQKIRNVGYENKFYNHVRADGVSVSIEDTLAEIEGRFAPAVEAICNDVSIPAIERHQVTLAHFVASQMLRTTIFRQQVHDITALANDVFTREGSPAPFNPDANDYAAFQNEFLLKQTHTMARHLCNLKWALMPNPTKDPYWTSDHPVFRHNQNRDHFAATQGIASPGVEIYLPLSPWLALMMFDPAEPRLPQYSVLPAIPTNVVFVNEYQTTNSQRFIYASMNGFHLARRILAETPEIGNPMRPRVRTM